MSNIDTAVEKVMDLIDALNLFDTITRGALGTAPDLCCELAPSTPDDVFMNKAISIPLDLTINGKHSNKQTLTDAMHLIHHALTSRKEYPSGDGWKVIDIRNGSMPQVIGREDNNDWIMASDLIIQLYLDVYSPPAPPTPTPTQPAEEDEEEQTEENNE